MDAQTVRQRSKDGFIRTDDRKTIHEKKHAKARRGLRSLAVAVALPLVLSLLSFSLSSPLQPKPDDTSQVWHPPAWTMNVAAATTAGLMGLAAWLVWAEGGMRTLAPVILYTAQFALGLARAPFAGAGRVGLVLSLANVAVLAGCSTCFRRINPFAGNLVNPCIVWAAFLAFLSYRMM
ncbi:hypothetical protein KFK09_011650 [Dendrobium nobile]|uniref:Uncharacterized protein n=1 Tax=Dendrobium nobile TaxID=94219 RepID=A0A8T3BD89_DENNO|nr:hypothetical protein KFK09_011650 [Dendrobium nobile]